MPPVSLPRGSLPPSASTWLGRDVYEFYTDLLGGLGRRYQDHGRVFRWNYVPRNYILLGAEATQWVTVTQHKTLLAGPAWQVPIGVLFRGGLLLRDGPDHRQQRKLLMPAFRQEALQYYLRVCEGVIDQHISSWPNYCPDIYQNVKQLTLEIAIRSFFGISNPADLKAYNQLLTDIVAGSLALVRHSVIGVKYPRALRARQKLVALLEPLVKERRLRPTDDMVGQLCRSRDEEGHTLTDMEIIDQMLFVIMAAHDTTASTLASLFYELALHPEWQAQLCEEARSLQNTPIAEQPELLIKTQLVIQETLRRHTPLKLIPRIAMEDLEYEGFLIPKKSTINVFPSFSHFMHEYWTDPERFDPLRFSDERAEHKKTAFAYAPFGGGFHVCIGRFFAEKFLSVILARITSRCSWKIPGIQNQKFLQVPIQVPKGSMATELSRFT